MVRAEACREQVVRLQELGLGRGVIRSRQSGRSGSGQEDADGPKRLEPFGVSVLEDPASIAASRLGRRAQP